MKFHIEINMNSKIKYFDITLFLVKFNDVNLERILLFLKCNLNSEQQKNGTCFHCNVKFGKHILTDLMNFLSLKFSSYN